MRSWAFGSFEGWAHEAHQEGKEAVCCASSLVTFLYVQAAADRIEAEDACRFIPSLGSSDVCEKCVEDIFVGESRRHVYVLSF